MVDLYRFLDLGWLEAVGESPEPIVKDMMISNC
jgi:hypothetical protein